MRLVKTGSAHLRLVSVLVLLCACSSQENQSQSSETLSSAEKKNRKLSALATRRPSDDSSPTAKLSKQDKQRVRQFWKTSRRATQLRIAGNWQEAIPAFQQALTLNAQHEDALYYLGNAFLETFQYDKAVASWENLLAINPYSTRAHLQLGALFSSALPGAPLDLERAEREMRSALAINKEESGSILQLGQVLLLKGEWPEARIYLEAARRLNARGGAASYFLGYLHWRSKDAKQAARLLQEAMPSPNNAPSSHSASSEGDTRGGKGPMLAVGAAQRGFCNARVAALATGDFSTHDAAQREYAQLHEALASLRH